MNWSKDEQSTSSEYSRFLGSELAALFPNVNAAGLLLRPRFPDYPADKDKK